MTIQEAEPYFKLTYWTLGSVGWVYIIRLIRRYL